MQLQPKSNDEIVKKIVGLINLIGGEATVSVDFQDGEEPVEFILQEKVAEELHEALAQKDAEVAEARLEALRNVPLGFVRQWINEDRTLPNQNLVTEADIQSLINIALTTPEPTEEATLIDKQL